MKKIILSLLLIYTTIIITGCNKGSDLSDKYGEITAQTEDYVERTATDVNGKKIVTKKIKNGNFEQEIYEGNKIIRISKYSDGHTSKVTEERYKDENGNEIIKREFDDGFIEQEVYNGNTITKTNKTPDGKINKSVEEILNDGTRIITYFNEDIIIRKFTEKNLGKGKNHIIIENYLENGTIEKIEEEHEDLDNGVHQVIKYYPDGRIQKTISSPNKNETTIIHPDGRVEKNN